MIAQLRKAFHRDEVALAAARERGARAEALLRDETLVQALADVERVYLGAWRGSAAADVELRERAHVAVSIIDDLRARLTSFVVDGQAASRQLQAELQRPR